MCFHSLLNLFSFFLCSIFKQQGGAVKIQSGASVTFTSCAFTGNTAADVSSFFKYPCTTLYLYLYVHVERNGIAYISYIFLLLLLLSSVSILF